MINPKVSLGDRAIGGFCGLLIIIISIVIGIKFGIKGVDIFLCSVSAVIILVFAYFIIRIIILAIRIFR